MTHAGMATLDADQAPRERLMMALSALVGGLAVGAVWALLSMGRPWLVDVAAPPAGMLLAWMMRNTARRGTYAAVLAALGTLLAGSYAACLGASARLADELGLSFGEVLLSNGVFGALHLGAVSLHARDAAWMLAGAALAFVLVLLPRRDRQSRR